jgi:hypothetical protein
MVASCEEVPKKDIQVPKLKPRLVLEASLEADKAEKRHWERENVTRTNEWRHEPQHVLHSVSTPDVGRARNEWIGGEEFITTAKICAAFLWEYGKSRTTGAEKPGSILCSL